MAFNTGRRRRVMKEEVLSASFAAYGTDAQQRNLEPGDTPRYGAGANIENHPQVTDFVPRRYRMIALIAFLGIAVGTFAEVMAQYSEKISSWAQVVSPSEITTLFSGNLLAWTSAAMLLATACYARLIHSLRRHRVDDYKGRYRVWRIAVWGSVLLSVNSVLSVHEPVSRVLGNLSGYSLLPAHAGWWLIPAILVGGWVMTRLMIDVAESRFSLFSYTLAVLCFSLAAASSLGWSPSFLAELPGILGRTMPVAANLCLLSGTLFYARYIVLDVQGLIEHAPSKPVAQESPEPVAAPSKQPEPKIAEQPVENIWVDGSEPEQYDDDSSPRRLSKAERKRLRKQKNQKRAA